MDRQALAAALLVYENEIMVDPLVVIALRERLAQMAETCETCEGSGTFVDVVASHIHQPCPICLGRGTVYPAETVERIARSLSYTCLNNGCDCDVSHHIEQAVAVLDALNQP